MDRIISWTRRKVVVGNEKVNDEQRAIIKEQAVKDHEDEMLFVLV